MKWYEEPMTSKNLWNEYRRLYSTLSFKKRKDLARLWYPKLTDQKCYNEKGILEAFKFLVSLEKDIEVIELGCWRGQLARLILNSEIQKNISIWVGFDISELAIENTHLKHLRFRCESLNTWFHETEIPMFNTFVSSHVFEHLSLDEIYLTIKKLSAYDVKHLVLEIPLYVENENYIYNWKSYCGGHVLMASRKQVKDTIASESYNLQWEYLKPEEKTWITVWKKGEK